MLQKRWTGSNPASRRRSRRVSTRKTSTCPTDLIAARAAAARPAQRVETLAPEERNAAATLSQWQLIWLRFSKHWLALGSFYVLIVLYGVAALAEFFAPYGSASKNVQHDLLPAADSGGEPGARPVRTPKLRREIDPITLKNYYVETDETIPLGFFVRASLTGCGGCSRRTGISSVAGARTDRPRPSYFLLGADKYGRDVLSRLIYGARISLSIGIVSIIVTFVLGAAIGGVSGYLGGPVDNLIQRIIEVISSFPQLPLWLALAAVMPSDWSALDTYFAITVVLSLLGWTGLARVVRGKILSLREEDYAVAARLLGASHTRIIARHLLPGFTSHIIVSLSLSVPGMILGETALSFLGLGPASAGGELGRDAPGRDQHRRGGQLSVAAHAGGAHHHDGAGLQLLRRRHARRGRPVFLPMNRQEVFRRRAGRPRGRVASPTPS